MKEKLKNNKELIYYTVLMIFLIIIVIYNNVFWQIGKEEQEYNEVTNLKSGNIIYNVPFEEKWLD